MRCPWWFILAVLCAAFSHPAGAAASEEVRVKEHQSLGSTPSELLRERAIRQIPAISPGEYFVPPELVDIPHSKYGEMVHLGRHIFIDTATHARRYVGNGMNCANCHLQEGRKPFAAPLWAAYPRYPQFRNKSHAVVTFEERIQDCFPFSLNGIAPTLDAPEIKALTAYAQWLSKGVPVNADMPGRGFARLSKPRDPTPVNGQKVYKEQCAICHGADGQGRKHTQRAGYMFPPLWGADSPNRAAGMSTVKSCAEFVKANMPLGKGWTLTDMESWDVCSYIWLQDRPWDPRSSWYFNLFAPPSGND